jgi:hypothetical protein
VVFENMRRLYPRGPENRGLAVDAEGAVLGPDCILVRRTVRGYHCISREEGAVLQQFLFGAAKQPDWLFERCREIVRALTDNEIAFAQITGLHLSIGDLDTARLGQLSRAAPSIKANFNPDEPRVPAGHPDGGEWTADAPTFSIGSDGSAGPTGESGAHSGSDRGDAARHPYRSSNTEGPYHADPNVLPAAYQGYYHDEVVEGFRNYLVDKGGKVITAVPLITIDGTTAVADMIVKMPDTMPFVIEVKTGENPQFTNSQRRVYPMAQIGGHVLSPKDAIREVGLMPGKLLPPLDVWIYWSPGPGRPAKVIKLPPPELVP